MRNRVGVLSLAVSISSALVFGLAAQGTAPEAALVTRAAEALGGRDRVMALKTLQIVGYGELAYFNGGGNITGDPDAPQKWQKVLEHTRTIDLEHGRTRVQQRLKMDFVFASTAGQLGLNRSNETLDGDVAYNIGGGFLAAPQAGTPQPQPAGRRGGPPASCGDARPSGHDRAGGAGSDDKAVEPAETGKPAACRRYRPSGRHADTGGQRDVESPGVGRATSGRTPTLGTSRIEPRSPATCPEKGIQLPTGIATTIDFRNVVQSKLYVDRNIVDAPIDDLSAPASLRSGEAAGSAGGRRREPAADESRRPCVVPERQHVLRIRRPLRRWSRRTVRMPRCRRILKAVNSLVPGKRVTQVIQTHHHFDHSAGLRAAVAEGLTIISRRGNEGIFREMVARPANCSRTLSERTPGR